jgi:hypothetical protein
MQSSGQTLASMGAILQEKTAAFSQSVQIASADTVETTSALERQLEALRGISTDVLGSIVDLSDRFDIHGRALSGASQAILKTTEKLDQSVSQQLASLDGVSEGIADRSDRTEQALRLTAERLATTLSDSEERASALSSALSQAADNAAKAVVAQFDGLRETASQESTRAGDIVRQAQETIAGELQNGLNTAVEAFKSSIDDMHSMTAALSDELATTRADIRRGVFELPEEARESTAALRQVVNEQVDALKELSNLVAVQGNARDTSSVQEAPAPRSTGSAATARDLSRDDEIARSMEDVRQAVTPAFSSPAPTASAAAPAADNVTALRTTETVAQDAEDEDSPSGGWISDLLRRASTDEGKGGALDAIRSQLVDALDERTFTQQWDNYLAGNKTQFSRRMYTLAGQQVFDDVRRQLTNDAELRAAAQEHLRTFEGQLRDLSARRASRGETRALLMSDDGRLYTVVGQALGRFNG